MLLCRRKLDLCRRHAADGGQSAGRSRSKVVPPARTGGALKRDPSGKPLCAFRIRAFSSEVDAGSRQENASKQESRAPFRFHRNGKDSSQRQTKKGRRNRRPFVFSDGPAYSAACFCGGAREVRYAGAGTAGSFTSAKAAAAKRQRSPARRNAGT
ncbi:hypothetical protein CT676_17255 [Bradyrhizobium sp. MOS001]|nr:hypothetical protein CT676_17255 [Bradyrhizobium sp. MOS001]